MSNSEKERPSMRDRFKRSLERLAPTEIRLGDLLWPFHRPSERKAPAARRRPADTSPLVEVADFGSNPGGLRMFCHKPEAFPPAVRWF